jgi:hypothetical protein
MELFAAQLEADQANREFMREWINGPHSLYDPEIEALRHYRDAAERAADDMITNQIAEISPEPQEAEHVDYPHWPGTLYDCPACEAQMDAEASQEYDEREYREYPRPGTYAWGAS